MRRSIFFAALVAVALIPTSANAYEFICGGWRITGYDGFGCPQGFQDNDGTCGCSSPNNAPTWFGAQLTMLVENQGGNGISSSTFTSAAANSAASWNAVSGSTMAVNASSTFPANNNANWGADNSRHEIFFISGESEWISATGSGAGGTLGVTLAPYNGFSCNDLEFFDADIAINGFIFGGWTASTLEETVLHEMGHAIGLGHPCLIGFSGCSNNCPAVMAASGGDFTTPQQDDVNGISALYPGTPGGQGSACTGTFNCNGGLTCVTYQGFSYCTDTCTGSCPAGFACRDVNGTDYCVRQGLPAVGEACSANCEPGALCVNEASGGVCREECNPSTPTCGGGGRCVGLQGGGGACFPAGEAQEGESCETIDDCAVGLICLGDAVSAQCYRSCDPNQLGSCGANALCIELDPTIGFCIPAVGEGEDCSNAACFDGLQCVDDGVNVECYRACSVSLDDCPPGEGCVSLGGDEGACFPRGDREEGDRCNTAFDCLPGLACVAIGGASGGECLVECTPGGSDCPHTGQTCNQLQGGGGFCDPAGGTQCACDVTANRCDGGCGCDPFCDDPCACDINPGCDAGCDCDDACDAPCACDTTDGCESGCACDPDCGAGCACDTTNACESGCACDTDCGGGCSCDLGAGCDTGCACNPVCAAGCTCDVSALCDGNCACDTDCGEACLCDLAQGTCDAGCACDDACECACDTTEACEDGCDCDPVCNGVDPTCGCDFDGTCDPTCACDAECARCPCNQDEGCNDSCACDRACDCACDQYEGYCNPQDPDAPPEQFQPCSCDTNDCPCECDVTTACDNDCGCDIDCVVGSSCAAVAPQQVVIAVFMLLGLGVRRRRR